MTFAFTLLFALQQDPTVVAGGATFSNPDAQTLRIDQATAKAIINWREFGVKEGHLVQFVQPGAGAIALNRVIGSDPSRILGSLKANGQVWLLNPNGVVFGPNARVDVGGLMASALSMTDEDFLSGRYSLKGEGTLGAVVNQGQINAEQYAALIGPVVENLGTITAQGGQVYLLATREAVMTLTENGLLSVSLGKVSEKGDVILHAGVSEGMSALVGTKGLKEAGKLEIGADGVARLVGTKGVAVASGKIDVTGPEGGSVAVLGNTVAVIGGMIDASGTEGAGGTVLVGGDYQGKGEVPTADWTYVNGASSILADAGLSGDGGKVIVWSDKATWMHGSISAEGGLEGGDGGFIETSGHYLDIRGASFSTYAPQGERGLLLLDPFNVTIDATAVVDGNDPDFDAASFDNDFDFIAGRAPFLATVPTTINKGEIEGIAAMTDILIEAMNNMTFTAGTLDLDQTGFVTLSAANNFDSSLATINMSAGTSTLTIGGSASVTLGAITSAGNLSVTSGGDIIATAGALQITGTTDLSGSPTNAITLTNAGNTFGGSVAFQALNVSITDSDIGGLDLGFLPSTALNDLTIIAGGAISDSGDLAVGGVTTLTAGAGTNIILDSAGNDFLTVGVVTGNSVMLVDTNAINLGPMTLPGTLGVTATGITDGGALVITGTTTLTAGGGNITLNDVGNNFSTVAIVSGNNVTLVDMNAINLAATTLPGTLTVTSTGITGGALTIGGTATLSAGGGNITLDNVGNNFSTVGIGSGANVTLVDLNAIDLGASTMTGNLSVTAGGLITDSGALSIGGSTTLNAGTGNDIALNDVANLFGALGVSATGRNVTLVTGGSINVDQINSISLSVTATGDIMDINDAQGRIFADEIATLTAGGTIGTAADGFGVTTCILNQDGVTGEFAFNDSVDGHCRLAFSVARPLGLAFQFQVFTHIRRIYQDANILTLARGLEKDSAPPPDSGIREFLVRGRDLIKYTTDLDTYIATRTASAFLDVHLRREEAQRRALRDRIGDALQLARDGHLEAALELLDSMKTCVGNPRRWLVSGTPGPREEFLKKLKAIRDVITHMYAALWKPKSDSENKTP